MLRPSRARAVSLVSLVSALALGCQDYNFNPVGHCVIQPGSKRVTLSNVSSADVLFVVDESGSMGGEQAALAANFDRFIANLDDANVERTTRGLEPIDFHIAVTTTSVFWNADTNQTCRRDCPGANGQAVCCASTAPARKPKACTPGAASQCPVAGTACRLDCNRFQGEYHCCADGSNPSFPAGTYPPGALSELVPCDPGKDDPSTPGVDETDRFLGTMCGTLETHYDFQGCSSPLVPGNQWPYPQGDFVSRYAPAAGAPPNPRVLHFDKELYKNGVNKQNYTSTQLVDWFKQNVQVGTCGSGQEQALQAARLAIQKALAGQQKDTRTETGQVAWSPPTATQLPASAPARWPTENSKLVLVFVGDEDDCSSPADPSGGVVYNAPDPAGADACVRDALATTPESLRNKQTRVQEFVDFFTGLGRPVAAGFILPAAQNRCSLAAGDDALACTTAGLCCGEGQSCSSTQGAQAPGHRLLATAQALAQAGVEVVGGSICDPDFGSILNDVAEIVKPPQTLSLPTRPADGQVTLLRIADSNGQTRKVCGRPLPSGPATLAEARATGADWWFIDGTTPTAPAAGVTNVVYINPDGACIANPGETYSADYLGRLPEGGCWDDPRFTAAPGSGETTADAMCRGVLGGEAGSWTCFRQADAGTCAGSGEITAGAPGTCICGDRRNNCPQ